MKKFSDVLLENKNTHMEHLEDYVLNGGVNGARQAINFLRGLRDSLAGSSSSSINVTVKWDGAPAIFAGNDPRDGKFFVAKKGIFNKNPKVYKTPEEIDADTSGDLATKLKQALEYLPKLGIKGVVQGDFLFSKKDLKIKKIDGVRYVTFHANTIMYAVPTNTPLGKRILKSKFGIVWHTTYTGKDFESMKASFGVDVSKFKKSTAVWSQDAILRDVTKATMSTKDTEEVNGYLSTAGKLFNKIAGSTLRELESKQDIAQLIEQYNNTFVRQGQVIGDTKLHVKGLMKWI